MEKSQRNVRRPSEPQQKSANKLFLLLVPYLCHPRSKFSCILFANFELDFSIIGAILSEKLSLRYWYPYPGYHHVKAHVLRITKICWFLGVGLINEELLASQSDALLIAPHRDPNPTQPNPTYSSEACMPIYIMNDRKSFNKTF